jgi:hypothetical protein
VRAPALGRDWRYITSSIVGLLILAGLSILLAGAVNTATVALVAAACALAVLAWTFAPDAARS